jgi:hypothetical protein
MQISRTRQTQNTGHENRRNPPVTGSRALVVQEKIAQPHRTGLTSSAFNPNRRWSAFLAHLTLQYDGVSEQRQMRAERLKNAIQSYGLDAAARRASHARPVRDLSI